MKKFWKIVLCIIGGNVIVNLVAPGVIKLAKLSWGWALGPAQQEQVVQQPEQQQQQPVYQPYLGINPSDTNTDTSFLGANVKPGPVTITVTSPDGKVNFGSYMAKYNRNTQMWDIALDSDYLIGGEPDKNLADLKREGGIVQFIMPYDGWINNSAGNYLLVNGANWHLGNYAEADGMKSEDIIPKGALVEISYQFNNPSAGFFLRFLNH